jgi:polyisoprenoid-binding protein YceI
MMRAVQTLCHASLLLLAWLSSAVAQVTTWRLDVERSEVSVEVSRAGLLRFMGHEHQIAAPLTIGRVRMVAGNPSASSVELAFDSAGLTVEDPEGPAEDVPEVQERMSGPDVLDVARYPLISFRSHEISGEEIAPGVWELEVVGTLDLHGVAREVRAPVTLELADDVLEARGELEIRQKDFEISPVSVAGVVKVRNELRVRFAFRGVPVSGAPGDGGVPLRRIDRPDGDASAEPQVGAAPGEGDRVLEVAGANEKEPE